MRGEASLPLAVCVLPEAAPNAARTVSYPGYIHEVLRHAGLAYDELFVEDLLQRLPNIRVLVTVGEAMLPAAEQEALRAWVRAGGSWLAIGGVGGLGGLFGVEREAPAYSYFGAGVGTLGEGYLRPDQPLHPVLAHLWIPLHFFNGIPVRATSGQVLAGVLDAHQRSTHRAAIVEAAPGEGHCLLIAPDVTGSVVRIQQGTGITRDGVSAPDGTAPDADGVLKSDDGMVLDWHFDRQPVRNVPGFSAFLQPVADQWREVVLRALFYLASESRMSLPLLWFYPRNLPALAHLSHDTDGNDPDLALHLLGALAQNEVQSTWCTIAPGYAPNLTRAIRGAGHELAMHYDAMTDGCPWGESQFEDQWKELCALFGEQPVTNKNHYLRWEGDTEFYDWCARRGIQIDQSKGASKTGEAGFCFGTCHPFFPVDPAGTPLDVLELTTPTQDLMIFAPSELLPHLLDAVSRAHGILHLLFHPAHIDKPGVDSAIAHAVAQARQRGMEWWTARRINTWERARRAVRWAACGEGSMSLKTGQELAGATVLWLDPVQGAVTVNGKVLATETVERWGFRFRAVVFDAPPGEHILSPTTGGNDEQPSDR